MTLTWMTGRLIEHVYVQQEDIKPPFAFVAALASHGTYPAFSYTAYQI